MEKMDGSSFFTTPYKLKITKAVSEKSQITHGMLESRRKLNDFNPWAKAVFSLKSTEIGFIF